jgi:hypothetical protein
MGKYKFDRLACDDALPACPHENAGFHVSAEATASSATVYPAIAERAEWSEVITFYDRQHIITYARLLTAEREGVDWRDGVRDILRQDPDRDPKQALICWESHLERARWISTEGFRLAAERTKAH